ncbi:unnamed protein product [Alopecurus aequalis]
MARCSRALSLALLLIAGALIQSSYGSRPAPREPGLVLLGDGVESEQKAQQVLSSKLARRIDLEGGEPAGDSAARSSCRSNDARVTCPPPALR